MLNSTPPTDGAGALLRRPLLGGVLALAVAVGIGRFAYTPILPAMQHGAGLELTAAGLLASANYAGYLVGSLLAAGLPAGQIRRRGLALGLVAVVLTLGLMAPANELLVWAALRFLSGLASAVVFVLASTRVLDLLRHHGALGLTGWLYSGVGLGIALAGLIVRLIDRSLDWRGDWLAMTLLAAGLAALAWRGLSRAPAVPVRPTPLRSRAGRGVRVAFGLLLAAYLLEGTGYIVSGTFLVAIVERMPGLRGEGASVWIVVGLAAAPSCLLWADLAGRLGYGRALVLAYLLQAIGLALPALADGLPIALATALALGGTFMGITTLTLALGGQLAPGRSGAAIGLLTGAFGLGQILGPTLAGLLASQSQGFGPALLGASGIILLGGLLLVGLRE
jgi:predicted MFS family arabinose efflux permease